MAETWVPLSKSQVVLNGPGKASLGKNIIGDLNFLKEVTDLLGFTSSLFDNFGGDGSDGDRTDSSTASLAIGSGKQYEDWTIDAGTVMTLSGDAYGKVRVGVSGRLTIAGGLSTVGTGLVGGTPSGGAGTVLAGGVGCPTGGGGGGGGGSAGFSGQVGGYSQLLAQVISGGAAGTGASGSGPASNGAGFAAPAEVLKDLLHLRAGPGGGAGGFGNHAGGTFPAGGQGGSSGGVLVIECGELDFTGTIDVSGGAGNGGSAFLLAGGGGGGGGASGLLVILAKTIIANTGSVTANGGAAGAGGVGSSVSGGPGSAGGAGAYLIAEVS